MFLADAGLYDKYFSPSPSTLDPYMFPESVFIPSIPPLPPSSSSQPPQHARYQPPSQSNPYPHPSHSSTFQAVPGPSSSSSHHPQHPHHRDHQHQHVSKKRRGDVGPTPPEELGLIGVSPSASASSNANPSFSIPTAVDFDPQYENSYRRTSRSSTGHHSHPSHLNGNSNGGVGPSGHDENGIGHVRSLEVCCINVKRLTFFFFFGLMCLSLLL